MTHQVDRGDDRYSIAAQRLLRKAVMWSRPTAMAPEWRLLRLLAKARITTTHRQFDLGIFHSSGAAEHPGCRTGTGGSVEAANSRPALIVRGSGYSGESGGDQVWLWMRLQTNARVNARVQVHTRVRGVAATHQATTSIDHNGP